MIKACLHSIVEIKTRQYCKQRNEEYDLQSINLDKRPANKTPKAYKVGGKRLQIHALVWTEIITKRKYAENNPAEISLNL